ncbi:MAG: T9SS type A sorting domain-containing protein [Bacteroidales bacterium]|nr:T9SS type A sorting domain-containing protein [Bacteroidales bacterium]
MKKIVLLTIICITFQLQAQSEKYINHVCADLHEIPLEWIDSAKANLHVAYWRASHGSQLTHGGMTAIRNYDPGYANIYNFSQEQEAGALHIVEFEADLQHQNAEWVSMTESYLDDNPECNVVMWAWCDIYEMDITQYLVDMNTLELKYGPGGSENRPVPVTFVYMTAHSWPWNGSGRSEWVYQANRQIRSYCLLNNKWLYDFNDLECYNPDGEYFGDGNQNGSFIGDMRLRWDCSYDIDESTRGNWGIEWMNNNPESELTQMAADEYCVSCEHSDGSGDDDNSRLQCILKGNAAWWLWANLAGWNKENPTFIPESFTTNDNLVYPNPTSSYLIIETDKLSSLKHISLTGLLGNEVKTPYHIQENRIEFDLSDLSTGIYFIYITDENRNIQVNKIIVE